jgi:hypothetical protein
VVRTLPSPYSVGRVLLVYSLINYSFAKNGLFPQGTATTSGRIATTSGRIATTSGRTATIWTKRLSRRAPSAPLRHSGPAGAFGSVRIDS